MEQRAPVKLWWEAEHLTLSVCAFAGGPAAARHIAATSRACRQSLTEAWADLVRTFPSRLYIAGGLDRQFKELPTVERYEAAIGTWESLPAMPTARAGAAAITMAGRLMVLGGELAGTALNVVERFDPWTCAWEQLPEMSVARIRPAIAVHGGLLFVIGGFDGIKALDSVEFFDPACRRWQELTPLQRPRYASAAGVHNGRLFVFGGELTDSGQRASCEVYDHEATAWRLLPPVRSPLTGSALMVATSPNGTSAFSLGGLGVSGQALSLVERIPLTKLLDDAFEETQDSPEWSPLPSMPSSRHLSSVSRFRGGLVTVGGKGATFEAVAHVDFFNLETRAWEALPPLPFPRIRVAVAAGWL